ncbi:truncated hemoglobin GlbN [Seminavis robusta]|uniref:Truncated hemoglobin GlbN n=1 Tax=Seminavis robusta TaxID=568900 RepID=A0A9N8H334_9STRA|nr:truncated hemoglobin GlbN [Seminavis robusta]|eukprot:Sro19_g013600.1 truncated hemoglobin GlbN (189) ;mRNA; f:137775-138341
MGFLTTFRNTSGGSSPKRTRSKSPGPFSRSQQQQHQQQEDGYLLDRLGGMPMLNSIVNDFVNRSGTDPRLIPFYEGVDYRILSEHQKRFFAMAFTKVPETAHLELVIKKRHQHLFVKGLNESHFDIMVGEHLVGALRDRGFNDAVINEATTIIAPLRKVFEKAAKEASWNGRVPTILNMRSQAITSNS